MAAEILEVPPQDDHPIPYRERVDVYTDLPSDNAVTIDAAGIYDGSYIGIPSDGNRDVSVIAEMAIPDAKDQSRADSASWRYLAVIKVKDRTTGATTFGLRGLAQTRDGEVTGINPPSASEFYEREFISIPSNGIPLTLGRSAKRSDISGESLWGFGLGDAASRNQVTFVVFNGELRARNMSQNGTKAYYSPKARGEEIGSHAADNERADWGYTASARDVVLNRLKAEHDRGQTPRHEIKRDSPILNGVYQGRYGGEAINVDYDRDPTYIDTAVNNILTSLRSSGEGTLSERQLQIATYKEVLKTMPYDKGFKKIDAILNRFGGGDGTNISLNVYIAERTGVCRHQALFAGAVIERLIHLGYMDGQVSVDRNMLQSDYDDEWDGHAWTRYTNADGKVTIIDVAQHKVAELDELMRQYDDNPSKFWDYGRPTDWERRANHQAEKELARLAMLTLPLFVGQNRADANRGSSRRN